MKTTHLYLSLWCLAGVILIAGASNVVLLNPSSYTDWNIPLLGAYAGNHESSPIGYAFYLAFRFFGYILGYSCKTVAYTNAAVFCVISCLSYFTLRPSLSLGVTCLCVAYLSLYACCPFNHADSPAITYQALFYDTWPLALGQLAIILAVKHNK